MVRQDSTGVHAGLRILIVLALAASQVLGNIPHPPCTKTASTLTPSVTTTSKKTCDRPPHASSPPTSAIVGVPNSPSIISLSSIVSISAALSSVVDDFSVEPEQTQTNNQPEVQVWAEGSSPTFAEEQEPSSDGSFSYSEEPSQTSSDPPLSSDYETPTTTSEAPYTAQSESQSLSSSDQANKYTSEAASSEGYGHGYDSEEISGTEAGTDVTATRETSSIPTSYEQSSFDPSVDPVSSLTGLHSLTPSPITSAPLTSSIAPEVTVPPNTNNPSVPLSTPPSSPTASASTSIASYSADSSLSAIDVPEGNGTDDCTAPGGGCVVFLTYIAECTTDACACNLTYPAQVCAECIASDQAVEEYNSFLYACKAKGFVQPTQTIDVECKETGAATTAGGGNGTAGGDGGLGGIFNIPQDGSRPVAIQNALNSSSNDPASKVGASLTPEQSAALDHLGANGRGDGDGNGSVVAVDQVDENGSSVSGYLTDMTGGLISPTGSLSASIASETAGGAPGTQALNSTHTFFATAVEPDCEYQCADWLDLAQSCTDDTCVCTSEALGSASNCSACIGQKGGPDKTERMSVYSEYASSCRSVGNSTASSSVAQLGATGALAAIGITSGSYPTAPPSATHSKSGIVSGNPFVTESTSKRRGTVTAEEANGIATVTLGNGAVCRFATPLRGGLSAACIVAAVLIVVG
ncbi:hypothetical protein IAT40_001315 [Kwoniella sp. CBS 6097]